MKFRTLIATVATLCLLASAHQAAATQIMSLPLLENAYVLKSAGTTDQNESESLTIKSSGTDGNARMAYLRFDLSGLPSNIDQIESAQLRLHHVSTVNATANTVSLYGLLNGGSETSWTNALTYSTRPDGTANIPNGNTTGLLSSVNITTANNNSVITLGSTPDLISFLEADDNGQVTLILGGAPTAAITSFASLTNTSDRLIPELTIQFSEVTPIPEPSSALLTLIGLIGLRTLRRKR